MDVYVCLDVWILFDFLFSTKPESYCTWYFVCFSKQKHGNILGLFSTEKRYSGSGPGSARNCLGILCRVFQREKREASQTKPTDLCKTLVWDYEELEVGGSRESSEEVTIRGIWKARLMGLSGSTSVMSCSLAQPCLKGYNWTKVLVTSYSSVYFVFPWHLFLLNDFSQAVQRIIQMTMRQERERRESFLHSLINLLYEL